MRLELKAMRRANHAKRTEIKKHASSSTIKQRPLTVESTELFTRSSKSRPMSSRRPVTPNPHTESYDAMVDQFVNLKTSAWFPSASQQPLSTQIQDSVFDTGRGPKGDANTRSLRRPASAAVVRSKPHHLAILHETTLLSKIKTHFLV
jgi:hypothetical protein